MKKTFYISVLTMFLLTGCSQEENPATGEEVKITFTANIEKGVTSRGEIAEVKVDKLICAVCKQTGEGDTAELSDVLIREEVLVDPNTGKATFTPSLLKGDTYGIVFWAYNSEVKSPLFDTSNLSQITFTPTESPVGDGYEVYTETITDVTTQSSGNKLSVTLVRPLAQINVATTEKDLENLEALNFIVKEGIMTLDNCYNVYNALNKTFSGNKTFTYKTDLTTIHSLEGTDKKLLATGYTFPESNVTCNIDVKDQQDVSIYTYKQPNLPTYGNHRTNLVPKTDGDAGLMTGSVSYEISIDSGNQKTEDTEIP